jgi:RNA polymerase sigma factor (TIGR02999 family)
MPPNSGDVTRLLLEIRDGRGDALQELFPLVYEELRRIAHHRRPSGPGATVSTTELVHEVYLRLFDQTRLEFNDRPHFFAVAAMAMRQIVVDRARRRAALKRGGGAARVDLDAAGLSVHDGVEDILSLDEALRRLEGVDPRLARVVELRFFGGLSVEETAEVVGKDPRTVKRDWRKARALLFTMLSDGAGE